MALAAIELAIPELSLRGLMALREKDAVIPVLKTISKILSAPTFAANAQSPF